MFRFGIIAVVSSLVISACSLPKMTYAEALAFCQDKADAAAGPQGEVELSVGTGGTNASFSISVSDSFIRGDDPAIVYETCMNELSQNGQISGVSE
ncbi:hypothetical protein A9Q96_11370 [Rhodobacterales bacterium 52_120_T64]|nr:hypothetical protein A9Q96_11370 [Rhodobacterales bacterium 52_120_T64]